MCHGALPRFMTLPNKGGTFMVAPTNTILYVDRWEEGGGYWGMLIRLDVSLTDEASLVIPN